MKNISQLLSIIVAALFMSCHENKENFDATGSFEAEETIISAEATGTLKQFALEEGQELIAGQAIGYIDTIQLHLKKQQLLSQIKAVLSSRPDINSQIAVLEEQLKSAEKEKQRFTNLVKADAATQKQLDDITTQTEVLKKQVEAQRSALGITSESINEQTMPLSIQVEQVNDQLAKSRIVNPVKGTVFAKYTEVNEMVVAGKPIYKIADLSTIILRAYITGAQLSDVKLNQKVKVLVDNGPDKYREFEGKITWINDKAEFTPKTIQTKDERADMVYAIKISTKNDGSLKLGMYAEVKFH